jgi:hypothetical protein
MKQAGPFVHAAVIIMLSALAGSAALDLYDYITVTDADIQPGDSIVWEPTETDSYTGVEVPIYRFLRSLVFVDSGAVLVIKPGTWIFGKPSSENVFFSGLVVAAGGRIYAEGTEENPIVFTAYGDDPEDPYDLGPGARFMWGGLFLLGNAPISNPDANGKHLMKGTPPDDPRCYYGGNDPGDFSGILRYISVRHTSTAEIMNAYCASVSLGGIGSATIVDHVEAYASGVDGFRFFGGTVNTSNLVAAFCQDDGFDYDEGWTGKGQFWFSAHHSRDGDRGGEFDGNQRSDTLFSEPTVANLTFIGSGKNSSNHNQRGIFFRDNAGGHFYNAIVTDYSGQPVRRDIDAQPWGEFLSFENSIFFNNGPFDAPDSAYLLTTVASNRQTDPLLRGIGRDMRENALDPRIAVNSPALTGYKDMPSVDPWFEAVDYIGAFNEHELWIDSWTALAQSDIMVDYMDLTVMGGAISQGQSFDLGIQIRLPNVSVVAGQILLNGGDVTSIALPISKATPLADGGISYEIPITGADLGAGTHLLRAQVLLDNGDLLSAESTIRVQR